MLSRLLATTTAALVCKIDQPMRRKGRQRLLNTMEYKETGDGNLQITQNSDPNAPLVLIFGWAGCKDRYLAKYSKVYEKECTVVRFTADIHKIRSFSSYRRFALELYEKILETVTAPLVICQMFSMNGCSVFCALWDLLGTVSDGEILKAKFKGIVFDSAPANVTPWQTAAAISFAMLPPPQYSNKWRETYRLLLAGYFSVHRSVIWLRSHWDDGVYERNYAYFHLSAIDDLPANQLYIYSSGDTICTAESINEFISSQKARKASISALCFDNSLHCQHYRLYPEKYEEACLNFLNSVKSAPAR